MLEKTYAPASVEARHYKLWEEQGAFASGRRGDARPYTIMMPPPNVTGSLHMGHALTFTLQDILIRFYRLRGRDALWQPGTDHAGIATQMVVERQLEAMGQNRHQLGREAFIRRVWEWKAESGDTITRQLRRLGASPDWARQRFTMDEGLSAAVRKVFVDLYRDGLIYRDKRLVNWDPKLHTAISDLEVDQRETVGRMWYFRYPIEGADNRFITVATTRPETMLGDTAVAVHPDDDRYRALVGKNCVLPIANRRIPIVADSYSDPEKGTGAVKITPAHDFNDFEVGRRHNLPLVNIFDENARLNDNAPEPLGTRGEHEHRRRVEPHQVARLDRARRADFAQQRNAERGKRAPVRRRFLLAAGFSHPQQNRALVGDEGRVVDIDGVERTLGVRLKAEHLGARGFKLAPQRFVLGLRRARIRLVLIAELAPAAALLGARPARRLRRAHQHAPERAHHRLSAVAAHCSSRRLPRTAP